MHRPPGMYPNAYGKAPPPMECINVPVMPTPIVDMASLGLPGHTEVFLILFFSYICYGINKVNSHINYMQMLVFF